MIRAQEPSVRDHPNLPGTPAARNYCGPCSSCCSCVVVSVLVVVFRCSSSCRGSVVVVVVSVCFTCLWWCLYFVLVSVVRVVSSSRGLSCVVVVVVDSVSLCATAGSDRASTKIGPRTAATSFLDVMRFSLVTLVREYGRAPLQPSLYTIAHIPWPIETSIRLSTDHSITVLEGVSE